MPKDHHLKARHSRIAHSAGHYRLPGTPGTSTINNESLIIKDGKRAVRRGGERLKIVWEVRNDRDRVIEIFDFHHKEEAGQLARALMDGGKGRHYVREVKVPI